MTKVYSECEKNNLARSVKAEKLNKFDFVSQKRF